MLGPRVLLTCAAILAVTVPAVAVIAEQEFEIEGELYHRMEWFGFLKGGTVDFAIDAKVDNQTAFCEVPVGKNFRFLICNLGDFHGVNSKYDDVKDMCRSPEELDCMVNDEIGCNTTFNYRHKSTIKEYGIYNFLILNCRKESTYDVEVEYTLINAGGNHLGTELQPLPILYMGIVCMFGIVLFLVVRTWFIFRHEPTAAPMKTLAIATQIKWISVTFALFYWVYFSYEGIMPEWLSEIGFVLSRLYQVALYIHVALLSKGYKTVRVRLEKDQTRNIAWMSILYMFFWTCFKFWEAAVLIVFVIAILMCVTILFDISRTMRVLLDQQNHLDSIGSFGDVSIARKLKTYRTLQVLFLFFIVSYSMLHMFAFFLFVYVDWIRIILEEAVALVLVTSLYFLFRPHNTDSHARIPNVDDSQLEPLYAGDEENGVRSGQRQRMQHPQRSFFVVQNPPTYDIRGKLVPSVGVARPEGWCPPTPVTADGDEAYVTAVEEAARPNPYELRPGVMSLASRPGSIWQLGGGEATLPLSLLTGMRRTPAAEETTVEDHAAPGEGNIEGAALASTGEAPVPAQHLSGVHEDAQRSDGSSSDGEVVDLQRTRP